MKAVLGYTSDSHVLYELVETPCTEHDFPTRTKAGFIVIPAHEASREHAVEREGELHSQLHAQKASGDLLLCYHPHPVVLAHPYEDVMYGGIFADGAAYALADGVIGV